MTKHNFEAETWKILELLTHSIYSNKEIFLRELISNASDAIDKARLKSITDTSFLWDDTSFEIKLSVDSEKNILIIEDNGIGMTEEELHKNIWTIAKSWTKEFLEKLKKAKEDWANNLIGQFWVWFYSSFMVADKVELETSSPLDKKSHKWISNWKNNYEVSESSREKRWTTIKLFIDEANKELIAEWKIKELVKKYSNYIPVPVLLEVEKKDDKWEIIWKEFEQINETKSIWTKPKSEVKKEEYEKFYQSISMDFNPPLSYLHNNVEGIVSYKSLLFIPSQKNMFLNMSDPNKDYGPKLYVQNVLILENAKELLPVWLRFISWVVETWDIPLNISREILQSNQTLEKIKNGIVKKVLSELKNNMEKDSKSYDKFLENFGQVLKEWIYYENNLKEEIAEVIKFKTLQGKFISLDEYIKEIKDDKKIIYYINWKSEAEVLASPYLSQFRENKTDVLLLTDPIDSFLLQVFTDYKENKLKSVTSSDIVLKEQSEEEKKKSEKVKKDFKDFLELVKNTIWNEKIEKVELNENLWSNIWALKTPENGMTPQMEKMMKSMWQEVPSQKRILELNPNSSLIKSMKKEFILDIKSKKLSEMINYSYEQAILLEGWELENMSNFVERTNKFAGDYLK